MTRVKDQGHPIMRYLWNLLVLTCIFQTIKAASPPSSPTTPPPPPPPPAKSKVILDGISGKPQFKCHVCTSMNGPCTGTSTGTEAVCNDLSSNGTLYKVYGIDVASKSDIDLDNWPPSLTSLAHPPPVPPGPPGPAPPPPDPNAPPPPVGWTYISYPSGFPPYPNPAKPGESFKVSSFADSSFMNKVKQGYRSCRIMKVWVEEQNNKGKTSNIPLSNPRIVRSCSFMDFSAIKGKDGFDDEGCRTLSLKTSTVQVCYCQPDPKHPEKPCNGVPYLRASQYWILLAFVLVVGARIGQTVYE